MEAFIGAERKLPAVAAQGQSIWIRRGEHAHQFESDFWPFIFGRAQPLFDPSFATGDKPVCGRFENSEPKARFSLEAQPATRRGIPHPDAISVDGQKLRAFRVKYSTPRFCMVERQLGAKEPVLGWRLEFNQCPLTGRPSWNRVTLAALGVRSRPRGNRSFRKDEDLGAPLDIPDAEGEIVAAAE